MRLPGIALVLVVACQPADGGSQHTLPASAGSPAADTSGRDRATLGRADAGRIKGDSAAPVWIVEVSDFQCPYCRMFWRETYPSIEREFVSTGIVRLAYLNLPLQMHEHAMQAAEAAMCASEQQRFWPVHDALFATQERWAPMQNPQTHFDSLALAAGVNEAAYRSCLESDVMHPLIEADIRRASDAGIRSTPYFFVGEQRIEGAAPYSEFRTAILRALAGARGGAPARP